MNLKNFILAMSVLVATTTVNRADIIIRFANQSAPAGSGEVTVGVFATSDTTVSLGGFDLPIDFGAPGVSPLPNGVSYLGVTNTIFSVGSSLNSSADPLSQSDVIVSDAGTITPFPNLVAASEAKLFDLRFNVSAAAVEGTTIALTLNPAHILFNISDGSSLPIILTSSNVGSLTITAVPEPGSLYALAAVCALGGIRLIRKPNQQLSGC